MLAPITIGDVENSPSGDPEALPEGAELEKYLPRDMLQTKMEAFGKKYQECRSGFPRDPSYNVAVAQKCGYLLEEQNALFAEINKYNMPDFIKPSGPALPEAQTPEESERRLKELEKTGLLHPRRSMAPPIRPTPADVRKAEQLGQLGGAALLLGSIEVGGAVIAAAGATSAAGMSAAMHQCRFSGRSESPPAW